MSQAWRAHVERLKQNPQDAQALEALEAYLEAQAQQRPAALRQNVERVGLIGRVGLHFFLGGLLFKSLTQAWDAWSNFFMGQYTSSTSRPWPEAETRNVAAALVARFIRIGVVGVMLAIVPSTLMIVQVYQIQQQNYIITEQNQLTREQFGVSYRTQLIQMIYEEQRDCSDEDKRSDYGQDTGATARKKYCPPSQMLRVRQEAARSLVKLYRLRDEQTILTKANLDRADFVAADFNLSDFSGSSLKEADFKLANLKSTIFDHALMHGASLKGVKAPKASFIAASLKDADLSGATFHDAIFRRVDLSGAVLKDADLSGASFYKEDKPTRSDYGEHVKFSDAGELGGAKFIGANLIRSIFQGKRLVNVNFDKANLTQANFIKAEIKQSSFKDADLRGVNLTGATLIEVDLTDARMDKATLRETTFKKVTCPDGSSSDKNNNTCKL